MIDYNIIPHLNPLRRGKILKALSFGEGLGEAFIFD
jgi:hypothetical protein